MHNADAIIQLLSVTLTTPLASKKMISRTWITCLTCEKPITARIQIGHEKQQPINFPCPHCGTEVKLTLILNNPPHIKVSWDENCEQGAKEGAIVNIGAGFTISADKLNTDLHFPSFDVIKMGIEAMKKSKIPPSGFFQDAGAATGIFRHAAETWKVLQRAYRFNRTGQTDNLKNQLEIFWKGSSQTDTTLENAIFAFLMRFMEPNSKPWLDSIAKEAKKAKEINKTEYEKLISHVNNDLKKDRLDGYIDIMSEYFSCYGEFSQTLVYVRQNIKLPENAVATSTDFEKTKMFYGNAYEILGSHLDVPAALKETLINSARILQA